MSQDTSDYFVELQSYDSLHFKDQNTLCNSNDILFGLYVTANGVEPKIISTYQFEGVGFFDQDWQFPMKDEDFPSRIPQCYFCEVGLNGALSHADSISFNKVHLYDGIVSQKVSEEHLENGNVFELDIVCRYQRTGVCEQCFNRFRSVRDTIFERNLSLVLSHQI